MAKAKVAIVQKVNDIKDREESTPNVYANAIGIGLRNKEFILNFGLVVPSYFAPHDFQNFSVARIILSEDTAHDLFETLQGVLIDQTEESESKKKAKRKE